jgi:integrase
MFLSKRNGYYYIWYTDDHGRRQKVSTRCTTRGDALKALARFNELTRKKPHVVTFTQFVADFLDYAKTTYSRATVELYKRTFRFLLGRLSDLPLRQISPRDIDQFKAWRASTVGPVTVNIELRSLKSAFNTALRWELIPRNPCTGVSKLAVPQQAPVYLSPEEFQTLFAALNEEWMKAIVLFAVLTGLRQGEILNLRWTDVDMKRRVVLIQSNPNFKTKLGRRRVVPLSEAAMRVLEGRPGEHSEGLIFTLNSAPILPSWAQHLFKRAVRRGGLDDRLHFHSLRHTFASWLVQGGATLYEVQRLLGHSSPKVTEIYSHLQPEQLHGTVNRIELHLD